MEKRSDGQKIVLGVAVALGLSIGVRLYIRNRSRKQALCSKTTEVSAPGKVLITGGYLVLQKPNTGLVLTVSARFHSRISSLCCRTQAKYERLYLIPSRPKTRFSLIVVHSPQVSDEPSVYLLQLDKYFSLTLLSATRPNPFVENSIRYGLMSIFVLTPERREFYEILETGLTVHLKGDRQFYGSQSEDERKDRPEPEDASSISKTGLGSSAALVSSLVGALFAHFGLICESDAASTRSHYYTSDAEQLALRHISHNVAQVSHCSAQGKVGSGFDVAAAFFGSLQYERFNPKLLREILDTESPTITPSLLSKCVGSIEIENDDMKHNSHHWDYDVSKFDLPPNIYLMLGDVSGGSETPGMVKKVLRWKEERSDEAKSLWNRIGDLNCRIATQFRKLNSIAEVEIDCYRFEMNRCAESLLGRWPTKNKSSVGSILSSIRKNFEDLRGLLRDMSKKSGVPIEPPEQTQLLDATLLEKGVLCAGVPGAGGFDAVFVLTISKKAINSVENFWATFPRCYVRKLGVTSQSHGIRIQ